MRHYSELQSEEKKKEKLEDQKKVFASVRGPGQPFWDFIIKDHEKRQKREALMRQLEREDLSEEAKSALARDI